MSRYPVLRAASTASAVCSGGVWNTPNPSAGIWTPLLRVRVVLVLDKDRVLSAGSVLRVTITGGAAGGQFDGHDERERDQQAQREQHAAGGQSRVHVRGEQP